MKKIVIASMREGAGKTSMVAGISAASGKKLGYIKPLGDRLVYKRKKNVDHDAMVVLKLLGIDAEPDSISLGFAHSKLRYKYDEQGTRKALAAMAESAGAGRDALLIEGGRDLAWGSSVNLDSLSVARSLSARLVMIASGDGDRVSDDLRFIKEYIDTSKVDFGGVIVNKIQDVDDFKSSFLPAIDKMGITVLGIVPFKEQLTSFTMNFLADRFIARVIAGEEGLANVVKHIFVGAMSTDESLRNPLFNKEQKLLITSGDRCDMIIAALDSDTVGVILTNNIVPPPNIISKAAEKKVPLLLVPYDTYDVTRQMDNFDALLTQDSAEKLRLLEQLVRDYVNIDAVIG
ncbi:MAG: phosphotransacetylase family protein [Spirochaetes bacterium]|nr:phosphotransacetylase family protein [Spirochaetota bacterium]